MPGLIIEADHPDWRDIADRIAGKAPKNARRSSKWSSVRDEFLDGRVCAICGGTAELVAHHIIPFHLAPDLELNPKNLLALCEAGRYGLNCHLLIGHLGNWSRTNVDVLADAVYWHQKLKAEWTELIDLVQKGAA